MPFGNGLRFGEKRRSMGDGFIQDGVMLWGPHTAVATTKGMALWNGIDLGR